MKEPPEMLRRLVPLLLIAAFAALPARADDTPASAPAATTTAPAVAPADTAAKPVDPRTAPKKTIKPVFMTAPPGVPKCPATSTVIVEVRGVPLAVPRTAGYRLTLDDGKTHMMLGRPGKDYDCNTPAIKNIRGISTVDYRLGVPGGNNGSEKAFSRERAASLRAGSLRGSITQTLPNGVQKIVAPMIGSELFQLPLDAAPTYDKSPVIFTCDNSETGDLAKILPHYCRAAYLHPSGLPFTYSVLRADVANDDFIAVDKAHRKPVDDMIAAAKAKIPLENKDK
jgi:hypothetical protein